MKMLWYSVFSFLIFFRTNGVKVHLDKNDVQHCYGNFSKVSSWKLLDHSYVRSSFSTIMKHMDNSILKDTLQVEILRSWIKLRVSSFIKNWEDIMKWKSKSLPQKLHKNPCLHVEQNCTKIDHISLIFIRFFFSQIT